MPKDRVPSQLAAERGGTDTVFDEEGNRIGGVRLMVVVTFRPGERGWRHYRMPTNADWHNLSGGNDHDPTRCWEGA